ELIRIEPTRAHVEATARTRSNSVDGNGHVRKDPRRLLPEGRDRDFIRACREVMNCRDVAVRVDVQPPLPPRIARGVPHALRLIRVAIARDRAGRTRATAILASLGSVLDAVTAGRTQADPFRAHLARTIVIDQTCIAVRAG